jgi:hypothetical protein
MLPLLPPVPVIRISNGTVTRFSRSGIDYLQVLAALSGQFELPVDLVLRGLALLPGGASGGSTAGGGTRAGGGGGGWPVLEEDLALPAGVYDFTLGAGGAPPLSNGDGINGSASSISGPVDFTAPGGGGGGGNTTGTTGGVGRPGGNGGGGNGNSTAPAAGGVGTPGFDGGVGFWSAGTDRAAGGGAGAGGDGKAGAFNIGGDGGLGVNIAWLEPPRRVCGGGGGFAVTPGKGVDGGTTAGSAAAAVDGGGSGGRQGIPMPGGNAWLGLVVRADVAEIEVG